MEADREEGGDKSIGKEGREEKNSEEDKWKDNEVEVEGRRERKQSRRSGKIER